jgi:hypothetical protein
MVEKKETVKQPGPRDSAAGEYVKLTPMHTTRAYFFGYFWFSSASGGREI